MLQSKRFWASVLLIVVCLFIASLIQQRQLSYNEAYQQHVNKPPAQTREEAEADIATAQRLANEWK